MTSAKALEETTDNGCVDSDKIWNDVDDIEAGPVDHGPVYAALCGDPANEWEIADPAVEAKMRQMLELTADEKMTVGDALNVTAVPLSDPAVTNLSGIECAVNAGYVGLSNTAVTDLTPLATLDAVTYMQIQNDTALTSLDTLSGMASVAGAYISGNTALTDITLTADSDLPVLGQLTISKMPLASLAISGLPELNQLSTSGFSTIAELNLSELPKLAYANGLDYVTFAPGASANFQDLPALGGIYMNGSKGLTSFTATKTLASGGVYLSNGLDLRTVSIDGVTGGAVIQMEDDPSLALVSVTNSKANAGVYIRRNGAELGNVTVSNVVATQGVYLQGNAGGDAFTVSDVDARVLHVTDNTGVRTLVINKATADNGTYVTGNAALDDAALTGITGTGTTSVTSNPKLTKLNAHGNGAGQMYVTGNPVLATADIYDMPTLNTLQVSGTALTNLNGVRNAPQLHNLLASGNPSLTAVGAIAGADGVVYLTVGGSSKLVDITGIGSLKGLTGLDLSGTGVINLNGIQSVDKLGYLSIIGTGVSDITPLHNLPIATLQLGSASSVSEAAEADFKAARPGVTVTR
jgi:hypothetical protein